MRGASLPLLPKALKGGMHLEIGTEWLQHGFFPLWLVYLRCGLSENRWKLSQSTNHWPVPSVKWNNNVKVKDRPVWRNVTASRVAFFRLEIMIQRLQRFHPGLMLSACPPACRPPVDALVTRHQKQFRLQLFSQKDNDILGLLIQTAGVFTFRYRFASISLETPRWLASRRVDIF